MQEALKLNYGYLFEDELLEEIKEFGIYKEVPEGYELIAIGSYIKYMSLLLKGAIKILREDINGDELLLYFLEKGDTCAMTLTCSFKDNKSEIRAIAETDATLIMIPVEKLSEWMLKYKSWRNFVLNSYHDRMRELLEAIDTIAFLNMDKRILKHLKNKAMVNHNETVYTTHKKIANDLHTSRVVVSRLLKKLEKDKKIVLKRNHIVINNL